MARSLWRVGFSGSLVEKCPQMADVILKFIWNQQNLKYLGTVIIPSGKTNPNSWSFVVGQATLNLGHTF